MRIEVLTDAALRWFEPAKLMELIAAVRRLIDTVAAYPRWLIAAAETRRAARATGDACVADSLVRTTGLSHRDARRAAGWARPRHARPVPHVTPQVYDDVMNINRCPAGFASPGRHRCHTPSLGWSHAT